MFCDLLFPGNGVRVIKRKQLDMFKINLTWDQLSLSPLCIGCVCLNNKIARFSIGRPSLYRISKNHTYLPSILCYFNLELHILVFDDILRKLLYVQTKNFNINIVINTTKIWLETNSHLVDDLSQHFHFQVLQCLTSYYEQYCIDEMSYGNVAKLS